MENVELVQRAVRGTRSHAPHDLFKGYQLPAGKCRLPRLVPAPQPYLRPTLVGEKRYIDCASYSRPGMWIALDCRVSDMDRELDDSREG